MTTEGSKQNERLTDIAVAESIAEGLGHQARIARAHNERATGEQLDEAATLIRQLLAERDEAVFERDSWKRATQAMGEKLSALHQRLFEVMEREFQNDLRRGIVRWSVDQKADEWSQSDGATENKEEE